MDYSKFLDEDFDVKEWVNAAFKSQKEGTKDQHATTLVMKLQMFIQEVNNVIEDSCQQTITNLPRVMRELEAVRQEAALLQDQMKHVKHEIQKVEHDTAQSMQMLLRLDSIKSRMQAASGALQEADNWTTLSADVDTVFESGDVSAISNKLVGMQQSLHMLIDVPDYAERCQFLETLKNRLEAMLSPQVVSSFSAQSLEAAQKYVKIFSDIDRLPQLNKYYHKCQKGPLLDEWRSIHSNEDLSGLVEKLTRLYDVLTSTWHTQIQWCAQVFTDPVPIVCELLTETLSSLDPSTPACIAAHLQTVDSPLQALIDLKQASERFAQAISTAIAALPTGNNQAAYARGLATCIYLPYKPYVRQYRSFEESTLGGALDAIPLDGEDVADTVTLLEESVARLFAAATQANERCCELTNGCGYVGLITAIQTYLLNYDKEARRVLINMREKCHLADATLDSEDWALFQNALRLVQVAGDLIVQCGELDQLLVTNLVNTAGKYCSLTEGFKYCSLAKGFKYDTERSAFEDYRTLLLDSNDERRSLEALVTRLQDGDTATVLDEALQQVRGFCVLVHKFAFDIAFTPLEKQLVTVPGLEIWTSGRGKDALSSDLPTFSLTPQEYITKIGNYLMTVPQQLEAFSLEENPALLAAVKHGKLPFITNQGEAAEELAELWLESVCDGTMHHYGEQLQGTRTSRRMPLIREVAEELAELWLESVCAGTMHHYGEQLLRIPHLTPHAAKQLYTDIDYLCNVVEDLGHSASDTLNHTVRLLRASESEYSVASDSAPQRLTSAVAKMRALSLD